MRKPTNKFVRLNNAVSGVCKKGFNNASHVPTCFTVVLDIAQIDVVLRMTTQLNTRGAANCLSFSFSTKNFFGGSSTCIAW